MLVEWDSVDGDEHVRLVGELDLSTIEDVRSALGTAMPRTGGLTLDLSDLTFTGAEGIRLFIDLARERYGIGCIVLANPLPIVRRILDLTQLDRLPNLTVDPCGLRRLGLDGSASEPRREREEA
jgi:anti-anti-sigma factor